MNVSSIGQRLNQSSSVVNLNEAAGKTSTHDLSASQLRAELEVLQIQYKQALEKAQATQTPQSKQQYNTLYRQLFEHFAKLKAIRLDYSLSQQLAQLGAELGRAKTLDALLDLQNRSNEFAVLALRRQQLKSITVPQINESDYYRFKLRVERGERQCYGCNLVPVLEKVQQIEMQLGVPVLQGHSERTLAVVIEELDRVLQALELR